jgi:hypothetical protein
VPGSNRYLNSATVLRDDGLGDGKPKSRPSGLPAWIRPVEGLENIGEIFVSDPDTRVRHGQAHMTCAGGHLDVDSATGRSVLDSIVQQDPHQLPQSIRVQLPQQSRESASRAAARAPAALPGPPHPPPLGQVLRGVSLLGPDLSSASVISLIGLE